MSKVFKRMQAMFLAVIMIVGVLPTVSQADDVGAKFKNGPYLLAPKEHSTVWSSYGKAQKMCPRPSHMARIRRLCAIQSR